MWAKFCDHIQYVNAISYQLKSRPVIITVFCQFMQPQVIPWKLSWRFMHHVKGSIFSLKIRTSDLLKIIWNKVWNLILKKLKQHSETIFNHERLVHTNEQNSTDPNQLLLRFLGNSFVSSLVNLKKTGNIWLGCLYTTKVCPQLNKWRNYCRRIFQCESVLKKVM